VLVSSADKSLTSSLEYVGRFAPSPTGLLHMGSLMAAVASFLEAKVRSGRWLLRIEDLDPPRELPSAGQSFLTTLARFGFEWDGVVMWQSQRGERYQQVLEQLLAQGSVYRCTCTRKMLQADGLNGIDGLRYCGRCRGGVVAADVPCSYRLKVPDQDILVADRIQGLQRQNLARQLGDFILKRADGFWAYQLAVVIDDADCGVSHIVRGADLLDSTPRQRWLQQVLGVHEPEYLHIPVITNAEGQKLSKQTLAPALLDGAEVAQLWQALYLLWQQPPAALKVGSLFNLWDWAVQSWDVSKIPSKRSVAVTLDDKNEYKFLQ
jgi:glutamyl-Q tRNA(Asp) synthetase